MSKHREGWNDLAGCVAGINILAIVVGVIAIIITLIKRL